MSVGYLAKCSNGFVPKRPFPTQQGAEALRWSLIRRGKWRAGNTNTYFCNECGGWHAGRLGRGNRGKGRKVSAKNTPRFLATQ